MIRQVPWIERRFNLDFSVHLFPIIFSRLEGAICRLESLISNADEQVCSQCKSGWSVKQHIGHLTVLEELWWVRLKDFNDGKEVLTAADMSNAKTSEGKFNEKTLPHLLASFSEERQKILQTIYPFDEGYLQLISVHPRLNQRMRLIDLLFFVAEHDDHHIAMISNLLKKPT